jgi:hypothetical protein
MTMELWGSLAITLPFAVTVLRDLMALRKDTARRHSIERLVHLAPPGLRVIDRTAEGAAIEIVVGQGTNSPEGPHSGEITRCHGG